MSQKVVARYRDGRMVKGHSVDIAAGRRVFHVRPPDGEPMQIRMDELKAVFFVRNFVGKASRHEKRIPDPRDPRSRGSTVLTLVFEDGEVMTGWVMRYPPTEQFFFMVPVDSGSNNQRILINSAAVAVMEAVPASV
jgi:hypothetical protein